MKALLKFPKLEIEKEELNAIQVLFSYEIPILVVCKNNSNELFLVYCCDIDELQYSIVQVEKKSLIQMLENQVAMDSLFISANKKWSAIVEFLAIVMTISTKTKRANWAASTTAEAYKSSQGFKNWRKRRL